MNIEDFGPVKLSASMHSDLSDGICIMEAVSFLAGEEWSDMPRCSSPVISRFCQVVNDRLGQDFRDNLLRYAFRLIGTSSPEHDLKRAEYLAWAAVRVFAPVALRAKGLNYWAERLASFQGELEDAEGLCREACIAAEFTCAAAAAENAADAVKALVSNGFCTTCAAYVAEAADYAAEAGAKGVHAEVFKVLDGVLSIGPSGSDLPQKHLERAKTLKEKVSP